MSYDVSTPGGDFNYTSNMRDFFRDYGVYPPDWQDVDRFEVADKIEAALGVIYAADLAELQEKYDAPNGWGDVVSAVKFLERVMFGARFSPSSTISVLY